MSRKKISTTIYVTPEQSEKLKLLHERTKVPVAVYIREGIDNVLRQYSNLLPGQLALDAARSEPRAERAGTYGRASNAGLTNAGNHDANDSDDAEPEPSPSSPSASPGGHAAGHAAHAAAKK